MKITYVPSRDLWAKMKIKAHWNFEEKPSFLDEVFQIQTSIIQKNPHGRLAMSMPKSSVMKMGHCLSMGLIVLPRKTSNYNLLSSIVLFFRYSSNSMSKYLLYKVFKQIPTLN